MIRPNSTPRLSFLPSLHTFGVQKISILLLTVLLASCGSGRLSQTPQAPCSIGLLDDLKDADQARSNRALQNQIDNLYTELSKILSRRLGTQARAKGIQTTPQEQQSSEVRTFGRPGSQANQFQELSDFMHSLGLSTFHENVLNHMINTGNPQLQEPIQCEDKQRYLQIISDIANLLNNSNEDSSTSDEAFQKARSKAFYTVLCVIQYDAQFPLEELQKSQVLDYMNRYLRDFTNSRLLDHQSQEIVAFASMVSQRPSRTPLQQEILDAIQEQILKRFEVISASLQCKITTQEPLTALEESALDSLVMLPFTSLSGDYSSALDGFREVIRYLGEVFIFEKDVKRLEAEGFTYDPVRMKSPTQPLQRALFEEYVILFNQNNNTQYTTESFITTYVGAWLLSFPRINCNDFTLGAYGSNDIAPDRVVKRGFEQTSGFKNIRLGSMTAGRFIESLETNGNTNCPLDLSVTFFYQDQTSTNRNYNILAHNQSVGTYTGPEDLNEINRAILDASYRVQNLPIPNGFSLAVSIYGDDGGELTTAVLHL